MKNSPVLLFLRNRRKAILGTWLILSLLLGASIVPSVLAPGSGEKSQEAFYVRHNQNNGVIVFVHGVMGDSTDTWTNPVTKAYWPDLLARDPVFNGFNIYVYGYPSPLVGRSYTIDELADNMRLVLNQADVLAQRQFI